MRIALLALFFFVGMIVGAQDRCASADYSVTLTTTGNTEARGISEAESFLQKKSSALSLSNARQEGSVIRIPVVVHILYNNETEVVTDAQVQSQIEALNKDYRRRNDDALNTPARFQALAADVQVEFYLASSDKNGRATTGIVRKYCSVKSWLANDRIKFSAQGGDDAWDSKSYLNIWVGNLLAGAGYSSAPGCDAAKDGVVINTSAFGTIGRSGNYSKGRTATHELGHWLGLKHIWGDASCGDDNINDTPRQKGYTLNCPTGVVSTCTNNEAGDMYMNFMDYTADACMNLFTIGQKLRMQACFAKGGPRESLLTSRGLAMPSAEYSEDAPTTSQAGVYPNPARQQVFINAGSAQIGKQLRLFNANGVLVKTVQVQTALQTVDVSALAAGVYVVKGEGLFSRFVKL